MFSQRRLGYIAHACVVCSVFEEEAAARGLYFILDQGDAAECRDLEISCCFPRAEIYERI
jgi:hypothetical protein